MIFLMSNLKQIYLILTGEDESKRPRSKKLIELIRTHQFQDDEFKIIISGYSAFLLNQDSSESFRLKQYLVSKGINEKNIILEEESMDTLGNMYFSYKLISNLIFNEDKNQRIMITLITENFHLKRSKNLFEKIFTNLLISRNNISFEYVGANSLSISSFFWKRKMNLILAKFLRMDFDFKDLNHLFSKMNILSKRIILDYIILNVILTDIKRFRIYSFQDFENYLFSLPIYNQKYVPKKLISNSIYAMAISKQKEEY